MLRRISGILALAVSASSAQAALVVTSPADRATVLSATPWIEVRDCSPLDGKPAFQTRLDGRETALPWHREPYAGRWAAQAPELEPGPHSLEISGNCWIFRSHAEHFFAVSRASSLESAWGLAHHFMGAHPAESLAWDWGQAIFLYGLMRLGGETGYVHRFHEYWRKHTLPAIDYADVCAPALTALALMRDLHDAVGVEQARAVAGYLLTAPRNRLGAIDHLGTSFFSAFYPHSIWLDSLMMTAVFSAQWGRFAGDAELHDFGVEQPVLYASLLQDPSTGLFHHSGNVDTGVLLPGDATYWLRGNGWVLASIAEILDTVAPGSAEAVRLVDIFRKTADGLIRYQLETGLWDSLANLPGSTYPETSGTALVSYALAKGVHRGWLPYEYLLPAKRAFEGVTAMLLPERDGASLPSISGETDPGPGWMYRLVPSVTDAPYGVGAYLLAAAELEDEDF